MLPADGPSDTAASHRICTKCFSACWKAIGFHMGFVALHTPQMYNLKRNAGLASCRMLASKALECLLRARSP